MAKSFPNTGATVIDSIADLPAASAALEGVMMFQKDSNELKICDGVAWVSVIDTDTPPGLEFITAADLSSATTLNVNNCFSARYKDYQIEVIPTVASTAMFLQMQLRVGTTTAGTGNYFEGASVVRETGVTGTLQKSNGNEWAIGAANTAGVTRAFSLINLVSPFEARVTAGAFSFSGNDGTSFLGGSGGIAHALNTSYDGFTLSATAGTFSATVRVYGYRI